MRMDIPRTSSAPQKLLILRATRAAALPHILAEGASAVPVTEADTRLRSRRSSGTPVFSRFAQLHCLGNSEATAHAEKQDW